MVGMVEILVKADVRGSCLKVKSPAVVGCDGHDGSDLKMMDGSGVENEGVLLAEVSSLSLLAESAPKQGAESLDWPSYLMA